MPKITLQPTSEETPLRFEIHVDGKRRGTLNFPSGKEGVWKLYHADHDLSELGSYYAESLQRVLREIEVLAIAEQGLTPPCDRSKFRVYDPRAIRSLNDRTLMDVLCSDDPSELLKTALQSTETVMHYSVIVQKLSPGGATNDVVRLMTNATEIDLPDLDPCWHQVGVQHFPDGFNPNKIPKRTTYGSGILYPVADEVNTVRYCKSNHFDGLFLTFGSYIRKSES